MGPVGHVPYSGTDAPQKARRIWISDPGCSDPRSRSWQPRKLLHRNQHHYQIPASHPAVSRDEDITQYRFTVGPASQTLVQQWTSIKWALAFPGMAIGVLGIWLARCYQWWRSGGLQSPGATEEKTSAAYWYLIVWTESVMKLRTSRAAPVGIPLLNLP